MTDSPLTATADRRLRDDWFDPGRLTAAALQTLAQAAAMSGLVFPPADIFDPNSQR